MKLHTKHVWKKIILSLVVFTILFTVVPSLADTVAQDRPKMYNTAVTMAQMGRYSQAVEYFDALRKGMPYEDSAYWYDYCCAMVLIQKADDYQAQGYRSDAVQCLKTAKEYFSGLKTREFLNSQDLFTYCGGRLYYLSNYTQNAIDVFSQLYGVRDSWDYYTMLKNGMTLPTQAPEVCNSPILKSIPAKTTKKLEIYMGPGLDFNELKSFTVDSDSELKLCARIEVEGRKWLLLEVQTDKGVARCWTIDNGYVYSLSSDEVATVRTKGEEKILKTQAEAKFGPDDSYMDCEMTLPQGVQVTAYDTQGMYTMVDYCVSETGNIVCVWVLTSCLR